ncbi:hypothetical protein R1sor_006389 [Riccia sorocarpa]|uniref:Uncharacterized protein n=1 Tax=Riccia sorocarpa TaxID=122646 RepID=A0ABD3HMV1_9MARC
MATSSRGDKGKAPMVEQEDIGTEEGELLDVHPPLPEPVGRSGSDRKRKKPAREEEVLGAHDVVHYALKIWHGEKGDTKIYEKCIREMMAFLESHPAIIRPIGLSKDKKRHMLLFPYGMDARSKSTSTWRSAREDEFLHKEFV